MEAGPVSIALNLLAFIGASMYVLGQWMTRGASPVDRRLAALFAVLTTLVGVRAARWWLEAEPLRRVEEALAALVPLFALFLAEGLARRHAPGWLKKILAACSMLLMLAAILRPVSAAHAFAVMLGGYVTLSLFALALLLLMRDRAGLSRTENAAINAVFVGLVVAVPLALTDFLAAAGAFPIRAGGVGLLAFALAVARASVQGGGARGVIAELFWVCAGAALSLGAFTFVIGDPAPLELLNWSALILALVLVFRIVGYVREQRNARTRASLWRAFAEAPAHDLDAFLDRMLDAPELENARIIEGAALDGYDRGALTRAFGDASVLSLADARAARAVSEQILVLFDEQEATHAVLIARAPPRLLFVNMPRLGAGSEVALQLQVFAKLAAGAARA